MAGDQVEIDTVLPELYTFDTNLAQETSHGGKIRNLFSPLPSCHTNGEPRVPVCLGQFCFMLFVLASCLIGVAFQTGPGLGWKIDGHPAAKECPLNEQQV